MGNYSGGCGCGPSYDGARRSYGATQGNGKGKPDMHSLMLGVLAALLAITVGPLVLIASQPSPESK